MTISCGMCGHESDYGLRVCKGCQGTINYGASSTQMKSFGALGVIIYLALNFICEKYLGFNLVSKAYFILGIFPALFAGMIAAKFVYRDQIYTSRRMDQ